MGCRCATGRLFFALNIRCQKQCKSTRSITLSKEAHVPKLTVEGVGQFDVADDKRLVLALTEAGIDQLHACGGECSLHNLSRRIHRR
jgi:hypothetical protein